MDACSSFLKMLCSLCWFPALPLSLLIDRQSEVPGVLGGTVLAFFVDTSYTWLALFMAEKANVCFCSFLK